jgi:MerR family transcriptional regulator, copper efflux regulator
MVSNVDMPTIVRLNVDMKSIGDVAALFELPTHVLRHWEREGLLTPARSGGRRQYTDTDLKRVAAILHGKQAGFSLADIRAMLSASTAAARREITIRHLEALADRIAKAQAAMSMIEGALDCTSDDVMTCPRFLRILTIPSPASSPPDSAPAHAR